jgi:predicted esterase
LSKNYFHGKWNFELRKNDRVILDPKVKHRHTLILLHGTNAMLLQKQFTDKNPWPYDPFKVPRDCKIVIPLSERVKKIDLANMTNDDSWFKNEDYEDLDEDDLKPCISFVQTILNDEIRKLGGDSTKVFLGGFN